MKEEYNINRGCKIMYYEADEIKNVQNRLNRLKEEREALDKKIDKLDAFLHKLKEFEYGVDDTDIEPVIESVSQREIMILEKQYKTMTEYSDLLAIRITYTSDKLDNMKCTYEVLPNGECKKIYM